MEPQQISSDLIRGHIDTIILYTLIGEDKFAEQISLSIEEKSQNAYKINQATLYSALKRLENLKYLSSYQKDVAGGGRRKFFTLTESGRTCIDENLSSWSYSRAIIDKLIGCETQPVVKTEYIEKIVQVPVEKQVIVEKIVEKPVINDKNASINSSLITEKSAVAETNEKQNDVMEVNFRNVLNGLIQTCNENNKKNNAENIKLKALDKCDAVEDVGNVQEVKKLNQTINEKELSSFKRDIAEIDFSDLKIQALKEGYKLKVSSKNNTISNGTLLSNKLNLFASLSMFLIIIAEILFYSVAYKNVLEASPLVVFSIIAISMVYPIVSIFNYSKNSFLTSNKTINADSILTTAIIVFNLLIVNFALVLLLNVDFAVVKDVILFIAIPFTVYADVFVYSLIRYYMAKSKKFHLIKK